MKGIAAENQEELLKIIYKHLIEARKSAGKLRLSKENIALTTNIEAACGVALLSISEMAQN